jgi:hypothetical protein
MIVKKTTPATISPTQIKNMARIRGDVMPDGARMEPLFRPRTEAGELPH